MIYERLSSTFNDTTQNEISCNVTFRNVGCCFKDNITLFIMIMVLIYFTLIHL